MTYWRLYYHLIWATKDRMPSITPELEQSIHRMIVYKAKNLDALVYTINGMTDHIHLAVSIPPRIAISDFVKRLKGSSSRMINQEYGLGALQWQPGYGVVSFGQKHLSIVISYVERQKQHHSDGSTQSLLESYTRYPDGPSIPQ